jgi:hypothetical protein
VLQNRKADAHIFVCCQCTTKPATNRTTAKGGVSIENSTCLRMRAGRVWPSLTQMSSPNDQESFFETKRLKNALKRRESRVKRVQFRLKKCRIHDKIPIAIGIKTHIRK